MTSSGRSTTQMQPVSARVGADDAFSVVQLPHTEQLLILSWYPSTPPPGASHARGIESMWNLPGLGADPEAGGARL